MDPAKIAQELLAKADAARASGDPRALSLSLSSMSSFLAQYGATLDKAGLGSVVESVGGKIDELNATYRGTPTGSSATMAGAGGFLSGLGQGASVVGTVLAYPFREGYSLITGKNPDTGAPDPNAPRKRRWLLAGAVAVAGALALGAGGYFIRSIRRVTP